MERYQLKTVLLSDEDVRVFMESLEHSTTREDLSREDGIRIVDLRNRLAERFDVKVDER